MEITRYLQDIPIFISCLDLQFENIKSEIKPVVGTGSDNKPEDLLTADL